MTVLLTCSTPWSTESPASGMSSWVFVIPTLAGARIYPHRNLGRPEVHANRPTGCYQSLPMISLAGEPPQDTDKRLRIRGPLWPRAVVTPLWREHRGPRRVTNNLLICYPSEPTYQLNVRYQ